MRGALAIGAIAAVLAPAPSPQQFRSSVDVVQLNVAVMDGKKVVANLTAADFEVLDNGVRQQVLNVSRESLPIDVTLVIDTSESLSAQLQAAIVNAANGIRARLKPADRLSLVTFNQRIQEQLALRAPADVGAIGLGKVAGQTSLNDAIGVVLAARPVTDRRQMAIVLTDGYDSTSLLTESDVLALAGRSNTSMFFIARGTGINGGSGVTFTPSTGPDPQNKRPGVAVIEAGIPQPIEFFQKVSAATGGLTQIVPSLFMSTTTTATSTNTTFTANPNLLDGPFLQALEDFRSSYTVQYSLSGVPRAGWHTVAVHISKGKSYQVRTRTGYVGG